jgi:hypothetical protein
VVVLVFDVFVVWSGVFGVRSDVLNIFDVLGGLDVSNVLGELGVLVISDVLTF